MVITEWPDRHNGVDSIPGSLPVSILPENVNPDEVAIEFVGRLNSLSANDMIADVFWRDVVALTGSMRTFYSWPSIETAWKDVCKMRHPTNFSLVPKSSHITSIGVESSWIDAMFTFETTSPSTACSGFISLVYDGKGAWKIWVLRTILEQLRGQPSVDVLDPEAIVSRRDSDPVTPNHFGCVVVGGGQAGLSTAGRLKALGVSYVVLEQNDRIGDNWMKRYESARCMSGATKHE